ncbi:hypothetical protein PSP6_200082 [Paraburkholderia tropica]|nr:hypothetical protein PSP6_200082 [Paraburkholderia tropica]
MASASRSRKSWPALPSRSATAGVSTVYISCIASLPARIDSSPAAAPITSTTPKNATIRVRLARIESLLSILVSWNAARKRDARRSLCSAVAGKVATDGSSALSRSVRGRLYSGWCSLDAAFLGFKTGQRQRAAKTLGMCLMHRGAGPTVRRRDANAMPTSGRSRPAPPLLYNPPLAPASPPVTRRLSLTIRHARRARPGRLRTNAVHITPPCASSTPQTGIWARTSWARAASPSISSSSTGWSPRSTPTPSTPS